MRRLVLLLAAAAIPACADSPAGSTSAAPTAPLFAFTNGPAEPGPFVLRSSGGDLFLLFNTDRATNLASLIRLPDLPGDVVPCGGTQPLEPAELQLVFHQNGAINQLLLGRQVRVHLYQRSSFIPALLAGGICGALASEVPVAEGRVDFAAHDNDTFFSGAHTNAFGWSASGMVRRAADGALLRYHNQSHGALAPDGSVLHVLNRITLSPVETP
jgi:hypothetical protein